MSATADVTETMRVAVVEDDPRYRATLETFLEHAPGFALDASFGNAEAALDEARSRAERDDVPHWDVVLMDVNLPGQDGISATARLRELCPEISVVILTVFEEPRVILEAITAGANGYLLKKTSARELLFQLKSVLAGGSPLTPAVASTLLDLIRTNVGEPTARGPSPTRLNLTVREQEVLRCLVDGNRYAEAAERLGIGVETVRTHVRSIYSKLQVRSVAAAVREALRRGLV
jgi:DNA-binding NarL/FixJ family response regulator